MMVLIRVILYEISGKITFIEALLNEYPETGFLINHARVQCFAVVVPGVLTLGFAIGSKTHYHNR